MSWLRSVFGRRSVAVQMPAASSSDMLDFPLVPLSPVDAFTLRDACEGVQIFGAVGSGKTSGSGQALALAFLRAGFGGLVLTAKPDECALWLQYAELAGRSDDVIVFSPAHPWRFNFLNYECARAGRGAGLTENIVDLFMKALEAGGRKPEGSNADPFWEDALKDLLRNAVELVVLATGEVSLSDLKEIVDSAAVSREQAADPAWRENSACFLALQAADLNAVSPEKRGDYRQVEAYWLKQLPGLSDKTRSVIEQSFTSIASPLLRSPMRTLFCSETTMTPEDTQRGKIIILDVPVKEFGQVGIFAQVLFKQAWQKATERRNLAESGAPVFLWADECQYFLTSYDQQFLTTARSSRACTVFLTQNLPNYYAVLGAGKGKQQADSILGNLQTKIFHANGDPVTNRWAAETISQVWQTRMGTSSNKSMGNSESMPSSSLDGNSGGNSSFNSGSSSGYSTSEQLAFQVQPHTFTTLRQGGSPNGFLIDAILFKAGRIWNATNKNYLPVIFSQRDG